MAGEKDVQEDRGPRIGLSPLRGKSWQALKKFQGWLPIRSHYAASATAAAWPKPEVEISSHGLTCRPHVGVLELRLSLIPNSGAHLAQLGIPHASYPH
jgi:hypothetical protein